MKTINTALVLTTVLAINLLLSSAYADWGADLALVNQKNKYKDSSNKPDVVLDIAYRSDSFKDSPTDRITYDFVISQNNVGYDAKDSKVFKGMKKRKDSIDLGARVIIEKGFLPLTVEATKDVYAGKGYEVMAKLGGITNHTDKDLTVLPTAGIRYQTSKVTDYYYGVRASEATANRKSYKTGSATTPFLGIEALLNLSPNMSVNADLTYEKRAGSVKNSPLTDDKRYDLQGGIGLTYWF